MNFPTYSIGTLVRVNASFMGQPLGSIAYVYHHYEDGGICLITSNGTDLGGFSVEEQDLWLEYWRDTGRVYRFKNVIALAEDFDNGLFNDIFSDLTPHPVKFKKNI